MRKGAFAQKRRERREEAMERRRWEVRVEESSEDELDVVLHAVARWASDSELDEAQVLVDGKRVELPETD